MADLVVHNCILARYPVACVAGVITYIQAIYLRLVVGCTNELMDEN